jgi:hypothetical protein
MSDSWNTKYGTRRVRQDPPTLQEAIFAASGLTSDPAEQAEIAAALMGLPVADVKAEVRKQSHTKTVLVAMDRKPTRAVVVERRVIRKPAAERRSYSA